MCSLSEKKMTLGKCRIVWMLSGIALVFLIILSFLTVNPLSNHLLIKHFTMPLQFHELFSAKISKNDSVLWMQFNETNDRILYQVWLMNYLKNSGKVNGTKLKLIYQVPHINYGDPPTEGQHLFTSQKCPVDSCSISRNPKDVKVADAVYLEGFKTSMFKDFLPKSKNQLWILTGGR